MKQTLSDIIRRIMVPMTTNCTSFQTLSKNIKINEINYERYK